MTQKGTRLHVILNDINTCAEVEFDAVLKALIQILFATQNVSTTIEGVRQKVVSHYLCCNGSISVNSYCRHQDRVAQERREHDRRRTIKLLQ